MKISFQDYEVTIGEEEKFVTIWNLWSTMQIKGSCGGYLYRLDSGLFRSVMRWQNYDQLKDSLELKIDREELLFKKVGGLVVAEELCDKVSQKTYLEKDQIFLDLFYDLGWHTVGWVDMMMISDPELLPSIPGKMFSYHRCGEITQDAIFRLREAVSQKQLFHYRPRIEFNGLGSNFAFKLVKFYECESHSKYGELTGKSWMLFGESDMSVPNE